MWTVVEQCLSSPAHAWSMGSFGAIAEFMWDAGESRQRVDAHRLGCVTPRGGLAIVPRADIRLVAYEYLSQDPRDWVHGIAFCLPADKAQMANRDVITELGPDTGALRVGHRQHILFDLGLQQGFVDIAIRTDDPALIAVLREACGSHLLTPDHPAMSAIIKAGPHRVFCTALGRLEVYQPIGTEKAPEGPHTHVLPKLMASGRAFSANVPIPDGYLPMLTLNPAHPCRDLLGKQKNFNLEHYEQFQSWLSHYADVEFYQQKQAVFKLLEQGNHGDEFEPGQSRLLRTATRVAIRQFDRLHPEQSVLIQHWRQRFDHVLEDVVAEGQEV
jgi:hypothetical protein